MFWTEHGNVPAVKKSNMDGSSVSVIISENIYWPNGIAIDHNGKGLCLFFISPLLCFIEILKFMWYLLVDVSTALSLNRSFKYQTRIKINQETLRSD